MNTLLEFEVTELPKAGNGGIGRQGDNARGILVISEASADPAVKDFLTKVLRAVQIELDRDALWMLPQWKTTLPPLSGLMREIPFETVLIFGYEPPQLGLQINWQHYVPIFFMKKTLLFSHSLPLLMEERARNEKTYSGPLWTALKHIFQP